MAKDILNEYGPDSPSHEKARATNGGRIDPKDMHYSKPVGPTSQAQQGPGLHGDNHGCCGSQGKH